ncbi:hypothetical protein [Rubripirellula lacrimiformis]|uniref:hypothetical protein n=1 Tax=Rubripirellula lacrimiformis TaxID=1930273 RepID=UPI0011A9A90B|nr:hypothetical protein [Rubripirellula lacrimiformis]
MPKDVLRQSVVDLFVSGRVDVKRQQKLGFAAEEVHFCWRAKGRVLAEQRFDRMTVCDALSGGFEQLTHQTLRHCDAVEICIASDVRRVSFVRKAWPDGRVDRGVVGWIVDNVQEQGGQILLTPQKSIAANRSLEKWIQVLQRKKGGSADVDIRKAVVRKFRASQYLVRFNAGDATISTVDQLLHGAPTVDESEVTSERLLDLERLQANYLIRSVQPDGRMTYLYYPSTGQEDLSRNNQIRQWMATLALARVCRCDRSYAVESDQLQQTLVKNVAHNVRSFTSIDHHGRGRVDDAGKVKLGAVALSWLAIEESGLSSDYSTLQDAFMRTIDFLWQEDGSFRTFLIPPKRNDNQNFYSGEALLAWSHRLSTGDFLKHTELLERFMRSAWHYKRWHLANRNPAFIPWHTQAYYRVWERTSDNDLAKWILEMNDWLLAVQQWDDAPYADCRGRFHDPSRPFGPPHASSTGVYLEGLADAYLLAARLEDIERADSYLTAIRRGLRSLFQLTFKNDADMFYVQKRERLRGGVRTTVGNNVVRVDNVQHGLMAIQKIIANEIPI